MLVSEFDALPADATAAALTEVCASPAWARALVAGRPYRSRAALLTHADAVLAGLGEDEVDAALAGHPRIGERPTHTSSRREQLGVVGADAEVLAALAAGNRAYEDRFGHVYLVCASGRSAEDLLAVLHTRLGNDPATERGVLRGELAAINRLRLELLLAER
jgi:2-oxo-4-hydroxy-4-carboxy-5-ureidoimidazoline decarboxylase